MISMTEFDSEKAKIFEVDEGEFHCPNCRTKAAYRRYEVVRTKRLFIFTFKGETLDTYVVCLKCERTMRDGDLRGRLPADTQALLNGVGQRLKTGAPIEEALTALMHAGMSEVEARRLVNAAAGILHKKCRQCALTYLDTVYSCKKCGHVLPNG